MNKKMRRILMVVFVSAAAVVSHKGDMLYLNQNENVKAETVETIETVEKEEKKEIQLMSVPSVYAGVNKEVITCLKTYETKNNKNTSVVLKESQNTMESIEPNYVNGWTTTNINVRKEPSLDSEILEVYAFNTQVSYAIYNEEWAVIAYNNDIAFISLKYISNEKCNYQIVTVPEYSNYKGFKTWMPYTSISTVSSRQYKLQQMCYTGDYGIRMYNGRYCIAVGTGVTSSTGTYIDIVLENGTVLECIVGDIKADIHTESMNIFTLHSNCCSEFIIDKSALNSQAKQMGNMSYCCEEWNSKVVEFRVYDINVFN